MFNNFLRKAFHKSSIILCKKKEIYILNLNIEKSLYTISNKYSPNLSLEPLLPISFLQHLQGRNYSSISEDNSVPRTPLELWKNLETKPEYIENPKIIKVAIIGTPNGGKSTLINTLCNSMVCPTSRRVHTTTYNAKAVLNVENIQVIFTDTPGAVFTLEAVRYHLKHAQLVDPLRAVLDVDLIAVVHDVSLERSKSEVLSRRVIKLLASNPLTPCILLLNKIDKIHDLPRLAEITMKLTGGILNNKIITTEKVPEEKNDHEIRASVLEKFMHKYGTSDVHSFSEKLESASILDEREKVFNGTLKLNEKQAGSFARRLDHWPLFKEVFSISARENIEVDIVKEYILNSAYPHEWIFPSNILSDQPPSELAIAILRGTALEHLPTYMSYFMKISIDEMEVTNGVLHVNAVFHFQKKSNVKMFLGSTRYNLVIDSASKQMKNSFNSNVLLNIRALKHVK